MFLHVKCYPLSYFPLWKPPIPSPITLLLWAYFPPTHPHLPHCPTIPLHWAIKPSQDQGPPLPLMPDKAPSAPSVLPLTPPLGSLCSIWWLGCEHSHLYWSEYGKASQETAISGSCQQTLLGISNSVWIWCLHRDGSPCGSVSGWPFLQSLFHSSSLHFL